MTAIGLRPLTECLDIFDRLRQPLELEFLELAIGTPCPTDAIYPDVPLILHDSCLYRDGIRQRLNLYEPRSWQIYAEFAATHHVAALSLHAPLKRESDRRVVESKLEALESIVGIPVFIEVMPSPEYWCSSLDTLIDFPLLLDVSHVSIWYRGDRALTQHTCLELIASDRVKAIHLSHNNGTADTHECIPPDIWFVPYLPTWSQQYWVTYESLPSAQAAYQRLDRR